MSCLIDDEGVEADVWRQQRRQLAAGGGQRAGDHVRRRNDAPAHLLALALHRVAPGRHLQTHIRGPLEHPISSLHQPSLPEIKNISYESFHR